MNQPGEDLIVAGGPGLGDGLVVPAGELVERFSRSPGPGGQSVNTADSRVELVLDIATTTALDAAQRERALSRLASSTVVITASEHRSQFRNRAAARERLGVRLRELLAPPAPPRRPTKPTKGSQRRRLEAKKQRSITKSLRGRVTE